MHQLQQCNLYFAAAETRPNKVIPPIIRQYIQEAVSQKNHNIPEYCGILDESRIDIEMFVKIDGMLITQNAFLDNKIQLAKERLMKLVKDDMVRKPPMNLLEEEINEA